MEEATGNRESSRRKDAIAAAEAGEASAGGGAAERDLRESEEYLRQITENLNVGVWIYTADFSKTLYVNEKAAELWGGTIEDAYRDPLLFLQRLNADDVARLSAAMAQLSATQITVRADIGDIHRYLCISGFPVMDEDGDAYRVVGITEDVTERIRTEKELHASESKYRSLVEASPYAIYALDHEGRFTEVNAAAEALLGRAASDIIGVYYGEIIHPEDVARANEAFGTLLSSPVARLDVELRVVRAASEPRLLALSVSAVHDADGSVRVQGIGHDVTEERMREQHLRRAERFASIGTLVGGVAHELNNPLQSIAGYADLLLSGARHPEQLEALQTIAHEARRASRIVSELRVLARESHEEAERRIAVDINEIVRQILRSRQYEMETSNIDVQTDLGLTMPPVVGDPSRLEQVLLNLVVNAEHAVRDQPDRRIIVRTRPGTRGVRITVVDNGPGIAADAMSRLFDPFYTTKAPGEGVGLGLSMVHTIVQAHGGTVHAESEPGRGAAFQVDLPAAPGHLAADPPGQSHGSAHPAMPQHTPAAPRDAADRMRILVVDDEAPIRQLISTAARRRGHDADVAADGAEAMRMIDALRSTGKRYDVIVSDLKMRGMGGDELISTLLERPDAEPPRVVLLTGDPEHPAALRLQERDDVTIAAKPLGLQEIIRLLGL